MNGKCGYPLADALRKFYTGIDGREDEIFFNSTRVIMVSLKGAHLH